MAFDEIRMGMPSEFDGGHPFSFVYGGKGSVELLGTWSRDVDSEEREGDRVRAVTVWMDRDTGLRVQRETARFADFPAAECLLRFD